MRKLYITLTALSLLIWACSKEDTTPPSAPQNLTGTAVNNGQDLKLTWDAPIEGKPSSYDVLCDGTTVASGLPDTTTTYTINGAQNVCKQVQVVAVSGSGQSAATLDLTPAQSTVKLYRSDVASQPSWAKVVFGANVSVSAIFTNQVDCSAANTGYFIYAVPNTLKDVSATQNPGCQAKYEFAFSQAATGNLAPSAGNYNTARDISDGATYFYWADNTSVGYGQIDANDYFGKVVVSLGSDNNGAFANLTIYTQNKVPGLRWVKQ
ncbi:MAG: fibronectin type III domain-containing protein [candidate division WOR-3 bacterium]